LAGVSDGIGPDLIYLPETVFDKDSFVRDVNTKLSEHPAVLVAVSEGVRFSDGRYVGEGTQSGAVDVFGHKYLAGTGKVLEEIVRNEIGCKVRSIELSLTQRCASHIASLTDINESKMVGMGAVVLALKGKTGVMATIGRTPGEEYSSNVGCADISGIANAIKKVPVEFINDDGNGVTEKCIEYLKPLIIGEIPQTYENGLPKHIII
jgi:6-phosphofructokinase 1